MSNRALVIYCGFLMSMLASSIDIILPAFSFMAKDLNADYASVQLTIPVFMIAVGFCQLVMGSLSDRFGRRSVLAVGLVIYVIGSLACSFAPSVDWLLAGRVLQGIGISAAPVTGRAILRDISSGRELGHNLATASAIFAVGPVVAPLIGAAMLQIGDWRMIFLAMSGFGAGLLVWLLLMQETIASKDINATRLAVFAKNLQALWAHPVSRFNLVLSSIAMCMMMLILTNYPAIFEVNYAIAGTLFAILFATHGIGIVIGQLVNRRIIARLGILYAIRVGSTVLLLCCVLLTLVAALGLDGPYVLAGIMVLFATSYLVVYANATSLVLEHHGSIAGFASAFYGFFGQAVSSIFAIAMVYVIQGSLLVFSATLSALALMVFIAYFTYSRWTLAVSAP